MEKATWVNGYYAKIDAEVAHTELELIRSEGEVTAQAVVASAKLKDSPLHPVFTWNNTKAANEFRLEEARKMIRSVQIIRVQMPNTPMRAYELTRLPATEDEPVRQVYATTEEILADPIARDELLGKAIRDALAFKRKYALLSEMAVIFRAVDKVVENAEAIIEK